MWFGTFRGLNRFDGYNFVESRFDPSNQFSVSDNHIRTICQDTEDVLLVGTMDGLNRYYLNTGKFIRLFNDPDDPASLSNNTIYKVLKDRDGDIWIGTGGGGLDKMEQIRDENGGSGFHYQFIHHIPVEGKNSISSLKIADIAESPDGTLWIATNNGLNHFDKKKNEFTVYRNNPKDPYSISNNVVSSICIDKNGDIWAGTWDGGLNKYDLKTKKFTRFLKNPKDRVRISYNIVTELYCDHLGQIWVGTLGGGLNKIMTKEDFRKYFPGSKTYDKIRFIRYQHSTGNEMSISNNAINSIYEDRTGVMWVGTNLGAINRFDQSISKFRIVRAEPGNSNSLSNNNVFSFLFDREGQLWIGTQEGLNIYNNKTNKYTLYKHDTNDQSSVSSNNIKSIIEDQKGDIWVGTVRGLNKFNQQNNTFKRYYIDPDNQTTSIICSMHAARDGLIWIGTNGDGLYKFNPKTERFSKYENLSQDFGNIGNEIIWPIVEDKNGRLWVGTYNEGLYSIDPKSDKLTIYENNPKDSTTLSSNYVISLCIDHEDNLWVGTSMGLNKLTFDSKGKPVFKRYFEEDGLVVSTIYGLTEDEYQHLWVLTYKGLSMLDPSSGVFTNYFREDGLQDNEFSINAVLQNESTGEIYAGGINGFNIFQPGQIVGNKIPPITKIIDLKILNKSVHIGDKINERIILNQSISSLNSIKLTYKEYVISFEFAALHYKSPEGNKYAYMLKGFDKDWNYVKNQRVATYTNLPPDRYTFMVKAANSDGVWNEIPTELSLIIKPPWWKTILFKVFALTCIVLAGTLIFRLRIKMLTKRQHQLEAMVRKRTEELSRANNMLEHKQEEITQVNTLLEEKQEEITIQNEELLKHRNDLELLVDERTEELKGAKIKAEESDKLKSQFLANMSHEIRTPMNAIVGFASLLDDNTIDPTEKSYFIQTIKNNSEILLTLINDILDISLIEANQLVLYKESFCIDDTLLELKKYYDLKNEKKLYIGLITDNQDEKTFIHNDPIRFRQIMTNLLNNAYKYTDHGYIRFGYHVVDDVIQSYVEDTGIGISEENRKNIFQQFHKIEPDKKRFYPGTGIGLSICDRLVKLMGGTIMVESEIEVGSVFSFTLPYTQGDHPHQIDLLASGNAALLDQIHVLVAEDEPDNFYLIERLLRKNNAKVTWAHNGKEAVEYFSTFEHAENHLVLMDIKMPVMNGFDACEAIKKINSKIPVIALTAFALAQDKDRIMKASFDNYISKPVIPERLRELLVYYENLICGGAQSY
jgi:signal transduction histidine kinase/ligand-binding sensor domain-containing protein